VAEYLRGTFDLRAITGFGIPFVLVAYLGLQGGGYDAVVRGEVGIAVWWITLLAVVVGVLPTARVTKLAWIGLGLLLAFGLWTTLGLTWTESSERTSMEIARVASYLGIFALCALSQGRDSLRRTVGGLASGIAFIGIIALLSRITPGWITPDDAGSQSLTAQRRLNYPLGYWNGLAALVAIGMPLLLVNALQARRVVLGALAAAAVPALALTGFYTLSRGGAVAALIGIAALALVYPRRLAALPTVGVVLVGTVLLIAAATQRDALENAPLSAAASGEADEMLAITLAVCAGVGLLQAALRLAAKYEWVSAIRAPSRRATLIGFGAAALIALVALVAAGIPGQLSDSWEEFKQPSGPGETSAARFESAAGAGRYQLWGAALDANSTAPMQGIGPGTFEFWEAREGTIGPFVRDAHSLYLETLAETGIIGFLLIAGLVAVVLATGTIRTLARGSTERRGWAAGATAAATAFAFAAAVDWAWELAVLPVVFLVLAAALLGPDAEARSRRSSRFSGQLPNLARVPIAAVAVGAVLLIAVPLAATEALRASQGDVRANQLSDAAAEASVAGSIQPSAASPPLQQALVAELAGNLAGAADAARDATEQEPMNWRPWLVLARIEAERGRVAQSLEAYREARSLNPRSSVFARFER
jgi:cytochrome c-type biogenesis protein CcmH/NrfG